MTQTKTDMETATSVALRGSETFALPDGGNFSALLSAHGGIEAVIRLASAICHLDDSASFAATVSAISNPVYDGKDAISSALFSENLWMIGDAEKEAAPTVLPRLRALFRQAPLPRVRFFAAVPIVGSDVTSSHPMRLGSLFLADQHTPHNLSGVQQNALLALGRHLGSLLTLELHKRRLESETARLSALATTDGLTNLANRRMFSDRLQAALTYARQTETSLSLILLDVDRFKAYNDMFGHPAGDEVLRQVGRILARVARASDMPARYGGEEFAVLLPETDGETAMIIAELFRSEIEGHPWAEREVTASFGVAELRWPMQTGGELVTAADEALYQSKANGRNRVTQAE